MKALVAPRWRTPPPSPARSAKWRRWATTSWRVWRSSSATRSRSISGAARRIAASCSSVIGRPSSASDLGERHPQPPPQREAVAGGEDRRHLAGGIALVEGVLRARRRSSPGSVAAPPPGGPRAPPLCYISLPAAGKPARVTFPPAAPMQIRVESEIGRLKSVLVHRPGPEIDRMVPSMMEQLLFDDILDGDGARREHELFTAVLERAGVRVLEAQELLADVLAEDEPRRWVLGELARAHGAPPAVIDALAALAAGDAGGGAGRRPPRARRARRGAAAAPLHPRPAAQLLLPARSPGGAGRPGAGVGDGHRRPPARAAAGAGDLHLPPRARRRRRG